MRKKLQFSSGVLRDMRRPSNPVLGPIARRREQERQGDGGGGKRFSWPSFPRWSFSWLRLPLIQVDLWTVGGGAVFGGIAWLFGAGRFGLGLFLGGFLCLLSLYSLKALTADIVKNGNRSVWTHHATRLLRILAMALVMFLLLKISVSCLLGAVASYVWFLGVLAWFGLRSAGPEVPPPEPTIPAPETPTDAGK